jgi:hypothetical protein
MHECRYKCERQQSTCLVRDDLECADPSHPQSDNIDNQKKLYALAKVLRLVTVVLTTGEV